jgi:predicted metal-dependent phosphoesterase TrpH
MRCDLHLHSRHSGPSDIPVLGRFARESYSEPRALYEEARRRGMDLVTLTDHDAIEGALELRSRPGTFVSEEVTCGLPGGRIVHLGVFGLSEGQHRHIAARRGDGEALFAYLAEQRIPACLNHPFSALTGARETVDLAVSLAALPLVEALNGALSGRVNGAARAAARRRRRAMVGGSDAHTLASVARAHTLVPGARDAAEFLEGLRRGLCLPRGRSGSYARLTADVARIIGGAFREHGRRAPRDGRALVRLATMAAASPALVGLPVVMGVLYLQDQLFALRHARRLAARGDGEERRLAGGLATASA